MKKILSLVLVLSMLLAMAFTFTACDDLSVDDVKNDPIDALSTAGEKAFGAFFSDDYGMDDIVSDAAKEGSIDIYFAQEALLGKGNSIAATLYAGEKQALNLTAKMEGETYAGDIFMDDKGVIVSIPSLIGDTAVGVFYETFEKNFKGSVMAQMMDIDTQTADILMQAIKTAKESYEASLLEASEQLEKAKEDVNAFLALMNPTYTEGAANSEPCAVITYSLTNKTFRDIVTKALESIPEGDMKDQIVSELNFDAIDEMMTINGTIKVNLALSDARLVDFTIDLALTEKESNDTVAFTAGLTFTESEITLSGESTADDENIAFNVSLKKTSENNLTIYALNASATEDGKTESYDNILTYSYDHATKTFTLKVDADGSALSLKGNVITSKNSATIALTQIKADSVILELDLKITFNAKATAPQAPVSAKDIVTMTEADWEALGTAIENSPLFELLGSLMG